MDTARDWLDREGLPARNAVDLEAFRVAGDDRADAFALAKFDGGHVGERDVEAIDLAFLVGGQAHAAVVGPATRDGFGEGNDWQQNEKDNNCSSYEQQTCVSGISSVTDTLPRCALSAH